MKKTESSSFDMQTSEYTPLIMMPDSTASRPADSINLYGVRTNNLKNITCKIPMRQLTVLTGVSGSGKSSLAFDTLFAEGQRRFLESMSTYARMFMDEMPKPPVDRVENCLPAIALRQQSSLNHPRSTVCTVTEMLVYMAQIFANAGRQKCLKCGGIVSRDTDTVINQRLASFGRRLKLVIYAVIRLSEGESAAQRLTALAVGGYQRFWINGRIVDLADSAEANIEEYLDAHAFSVLIDRVVYDPQKGIDGRLAEALEAGFELGEDRLNADIIEKDGTQTLMFDRRRTCHQCGEIYRPLQPEVFDPNSTLGACPVCTGFGSVSGIDWKRVINPNLSIEHNAIIPLRTPTTHARKLQLLSFCTRQNIPINIPFGELSAEQQHAVKFGLPPYTGVMGYFTYLQSNNSKFSSRIQIARFRGYTACTSCAGSGLSDLAQSVSLNEQNMASLLAMTVSEALEFFRCLPSDLIDASGSRAPYESIMIRLQTLESVGLGYLTLNRRTKTLSGGECQRLYLSCGLGRGLTDTLYVLDEPTAGLHPADSERLCTVMHALRDMGNTLVVVEHDTDVIEKADHIIELGPSGGDGGGRIIYEGNVAGLTQSSTPTGQMLRSKDRTHLCASTVTPKQQIVIDGASLHNLKNISLSIPVGRLVAVAGVSGSGKSTLIHDILYQNWLISQSDMTETADSLNDDAGEQEIDAGASVHGLENFSEVVMMEQGSSGRSLRASVATMTKAFSAIRQIMANQPEAVRKNLAPGAFSFNSALGRCPDCEGIGFKTIEMMFLNDLTIPCPTCHGHRYKPEILDIKYKSKNISDILDMTIAEAMHFFADSRGISDTLNALCDVGLDYIRLGQSTSTLSGGEFQRLRLSTYLDRAPSDCARTLFIFDEPTVGLHMQDISNLLIALHRLTARGASIIVIEHNLDLIAQADRVIELGPTGGPGGGHVLFEGTPKDLSKQNTPTGRALAKFCI